MIKTSLNRAVFSLSLSHEVLAYCTAIVLHIIDNPMLLVVGILNGNGESIYVVSYS